MHPDLLGLTERVVLLPHLGSATEPIRRRMAAMAAASIVESSRGQLPQNCLNPEALRDR